jgi:glycosyltransferase involved in cell wall biosynthesis
MHNQTILQAHNFYRSSTPSGENAAVEREYALLLDHRFRVERWWRHSDDLIKAGPLACAKSMLSLHASESRICSYIRAMRGAGHGILHAHNPWPTLTYGLFEAAKSCGLRTVQSLHNYRLIASNTHLIDTSGAHRPKSSRERDEVRRRAAVHSGRIANRLYTRALHRYWLEQVPQTAVDAYICLTSFQKARMVEAGIPEPKIVIKPNFAEHHSTYGDATGGYALFVGRLSPEKGVEELARAWPRTGIPLAIVGSGPLAPRLAAIPGVNLLGRRTGDEVRELMAKARFLVMNSTWYEGFPLVVVEAFAAGLPCLVPAIGSLNELIEDGATGLHFDQASNDDLFDQAKRLWELAPSLSERCRVEYEQRYTPLRNIRILARIYRNISDGRRPDEGAENC